MEVLRCSPVCQWQAKNVDGCLCFDDLGASSGQISIIPVNIDSGTEVSINTLGAIGVEMVALFIFLSYREHLISIPALSLA